MQELVLSLRRHVLTFPRSLDFIKLTVALNFRGFMCNSLVYVYLTSVFQYKAINMVAPI